MSEQFGKVTVRCTDCPMTRTVDIGSPMFLTGCPECGGETHRENERWS